MGLFSTITSSYPNLGEEFVGDFQTKDLEGLMDHYWLSPAGELFFVDLTEAYALSTDDRRDKDIFNYFKWDKTGRNGRLKACDHTGPLRMYTIRHGAFAEAFFYFKAGKIMLVLEKNGVCCYDNHQSIRRSIFSPFPGL